MTLEIKKGDEGGEESWKALTKAASFALCVEARGPKSFDSSNVTVIRSVTYRLLSSVTILRMVMGMVIGEGNDHSDPLCVSSSHHIPIFMFKLRASIRREKRGQKIGRSSRARSARRALPTGRNNSAEGLAG